MVSNRIIIATDHTECSEQATDWLAQSGLLTDSQVLVTHVSNKTDCSSNFAVVETTAATLQAACPSVKIKTSLEDGHAGQRLLEKASKWQSDLIVLGASNSSGLDRLLLGSVSQFVAERAHCPVIVARRTNPTKNNNVLVAVDNSEGSAAALEWISEQPWAKRKNFVIVSVRHALPSSFSIGTSTAQASEMLLRQECEESLISHLIARWSDMLAENLGQEMIPFAISEGDPVQTILEAANHWPIGMIVVGSSQHASLIKRVLGHVSQSIATQAACTVTVVRGLTSTRFDPARTAISKSSELAQVMSEKPHPARIQGAIVANNLRPSTYY